MQTDDLKDKCRSSLVGGTIGDTLGYPVEFVDFFEARCLMMTLRKPMPDSTQDSYPRLNSHWHDNERDTWALFPPKGVKYVLWVVRSALSRLPKNSVGYEDQSNATEMAEAIFFVGIHQTLPHGDVKTVARIINETIRQKHQNQK